MKYKIVYRYEDANKLLRLNHRLIEIRPSQRNDGGYIFAFEVTEGFLDAFYPIINAHNKQKREEEWKIRQSKRTVEL